MQLEGPNRPKIAHGQNRAKIAHGQNRPKIAQGLGSLLGWTKEAYVGYLGLVLTHSSRLGATWGGELVIRLSWHGAMT